MLPIANETLEEENVVAFNAAKLETMPPTRTINAP
jgi:hypothetical protein